MTRYAHFGPIRHIFVYFSLFILVWAKQTGDMFLFMFHHLPSGYSGHVLYYVRSKRSPENLTPSQHKTLNQYWCDVGTPSTTLDQHHTNIGSICHFFLGTHCRISKRSINLLFWFAGRAASLTGDQWSFPDWVAVSPERVRRLSGPGQAAGPPG